MNPEKTNPKNLARKPNNQPKTQLRGASYATTSPYRLTDEDAHYDAYFGYQDVQDSVIGDGKSSSRFVGLYETSPEACQQLHEKMISHSARLAIAQLLEEDEAVPTDMPTTYIHSRLDSTTNTRVVQTLDRDGRLHVSQLPARIGKPY